MFRASRAISLLFHSRSISTPLSTSQSKQPIVVMPYKQNKDILTARLQATGAQPSLFLYSNQYILVRSAAEIAQTSLTAFSQYSLYKTATQHINRDNVTQSGGLQQGFAVDFNSYATLCLARCNIICLYLAFSPQHCLLLHSSLLVQNIQVTQQLQLDLENAVQPRGLARQRRLSRQAILRQGENLAQSVLVITADKLPSAQSLRQSKVLTSQVRAGADAIGSTTLCLLVDTSNLTRRRPHLKPRKIAANLLLGRRECVCT